MEWVANDDTSHLMVDDQRRSWTAATPEYNHFNIFEDHLIASPALGGKCETVYNVLSTHYDVR